MLLIKKLIFNLIIFSFTLSVQAKPVSYVDHAIAQFAGEIGLISLGLGKKMTPRYALGFLYGFVPAEVSKGPVIETLAFKQTYQFYQWDRIQFYLGGTIYHVIGLKYQTSAYGVTPNNYYPIGSIRGLAFLGSSITTSSRDKVSLYFESGMNDVWFTNYLNNMNTINPAKYISMALGFKKDF